MPIHNKLVRDRIPEIIERSGKTPHCRTLSHDEYLTELDRKLNEECAEYQADKSLEELADMLEVIYAIAEARRNAGLVVENPNSIFAKGDYTDKEAQRNILANPFKRFEDMQMLRHTKTLGIIEVEPTVWKRLTAEEKMEIGEICEKKLENYFVRLK